jgi:hypothetical protein
MKKTFILIACLAILSTSALAAVSSYSFPKAPVSWGNPVSFNNLSPGFFQIMFRDVNGTIRIATYGISGTSMDTLKDPQLMMVFTFDKTEPKAGPN